ncbi:MAG: HAMP domain-containing histidine kinase [Acidimicrobiia bacterium]|nr:HAMP domain-containing histidine kinase [Acidimicrobiia bacterium]
MRSATRGAAVVLLVTLIAVALIFSNTFAARRVTDSARILHLSEATIGSNAVTLKSLAQSLLLAEDEILGVADGESVEASLVDSRDALDRLESNAAALSDALGSGGSGLATASELALASGRSVITLIENGDVETAGPMLAGETLRTFEFLRDVAADHQRSAAESVEMTSSFIARLGSFPAFLVAFLVPGAAILIYRRIARGQLEVAEAQLDARLEAEREIVVAKDEFVASISHELRTPLTTIYGFSEILLDEGLVDPGDATELLTLINTESAELHRMVEDLLTTARWEAGTIAFQIGWVDLREELDVNRSALARGGLIIEDRIEAEKLWADPMRVRQILRNLLSNADRHGGDLVRVSSVERGDSVTIVVADDGDGVPPEKEARLFTRYVHDGVDPLIVGSVGMGLAVVKILAEAMNGTVGYERRDGWSLFIVTLPSRMDAYAGESSEEGLRRSEVP